MVANCKFVSTAAPGELADYYMRPTEPRQDRDMAAEDMRQPVPEDHDGTVPRLRPDASDDVLRRMGFASREVPTRDQVREVLAGRRADGEPTGRRISSEYTRRDGTDCRPKDFMDITLSTDISFGLSLANAETRACGALILSVVHAAADEAMMAFEHKIGWTKRRDGAGGFREEQGELFWMRFTHHTTRPAADGSVAPSLHMHHVVPNAVFLPNGRVGAINMQRMHGFVHELGARFNQRLAARAAEVGIETRRHPQTGGAIVAEVPEHVRQAFGQRGQDMRRMAENEARRSGLDFNQMPAAAQRSWIRDTHRRSQGTRRDGVAMRPIWRAKAASLGWLPADVARPALASPTVLPGGAGPTLMQRAEALRQRMTQAWQTARLQIEQAEVRGRHWGMSLMPSMQRAVGLAQALVPQLTQRAARLRQATSDLGRRISPMVQRVAAMAGASALVRRWAPRVAQVEAVVMGAAVTSQAATMPAEPNKLDRLMLVYARKVRDGEMPMSDAAALFAAAEERNVKPVDYNPVHQTYSYPKGAPGPENRYQREEKWTDRIAEKIDQLDAGTGWKPTQAPAPTMKRSGPRLTQ